MGGHSFFSVDTGRGSGGTSGEYCFGDFAVLYRTDAVAEPLREALARSGMPYLNLSHEPLTLLAAGRALVAALQTNTGAELSLAASMDAAFAALGPAATTPALAALRTLLCTMAGDAATTRPQLADVIATATAGDAMPQADRISLLTIHAAKGLEFGVVFIIGCEDGLLPLRFGGTEVDLDEERRILFVGASRARERLILTHAQKRLWRGAVRDTTRSPFLDDIEERLTEAGRSTLPARRGSRDDGQLTLF